MKIKRLIFIIFCFLIIIYTISSSFFSCSGEEDEYVRATPATPTPNICEKAAVPCDRHGSACDLISRLMSTYYNNECIFDFLGYSDAEIGTIACKLSAFWEEFLYQISMGSDFDENPVLSLYYDYIEDPIVSGFYKEIAVRKIKRGYFSLPYINSLPINTSCKVAPLSFIYDDLTTFGSTDEYELSCEDWDDQAYLIYQLSITDCSPESYITLEIKSNSNHYTSSDFLGEEDLLSFAGVSAYDYCQILKTNITNLNEETGFVNLMISFTPDCGESDFTSVEATDNMKTLFTYLKNEGETEEEIRALVDEMFSPGNEMDMFFIDTLNRARDISIIAESVEYTIYESYRLKESLFFPSLAGLCDEE